MKAVLFRSKERFQSFQQALTAQKIDFVILDFESDQWLDFDFSDIDFIIYYPSFRYSSNYRLSLLHVLDNLTHIKNQFPHLMVYPDVNAIPFYNDKYKQYLYLNTHNFPFPATVPLLGDEFLRQAETRLGYPMVIKNRHGAAGSYVFLARNRRELEQLYNVSRLNFVNRFSVKYYWRFTARRIFWYFFLKEKRMLYPFLSEPLLAQQFVHHSRDLKLVIGNGEVVEGHWRRKAGESMWKVNIDSGGIGEWSFIPEEAFRLARKLAGHLDVRWLNLDLFETEDGFLISEFSPVWHHYAYKEKSSFVYKDDYNIDMPLEESLNLEKIIVKSFIEPVRMVK